MAQGSLEALIRRLRRVVRPGLGDGTSDAELLERFVRGRDEAAFEVLVWRHGVMVLHVCRRILHREDDAEDAFQATFLTLVRKAAAIGKRASVGSWLYKVAYRVALRARAVAPIRPLSDEPADNQAGSPLTGLLRREMRSALDEEVSRLPEKYRAAFILCHLEGLTLEAAARALGCPPGTVGTRLARARALLRRRLDRRGFDASASGVSPGMVPALPVALVGATIKAAQLGTADQAAAAGIISARAAARAKGVMRTMSLTKWSLLTAIALPLTLLGAAFLGRHAGAGESAARERASRRAPAGGADAGVVFRWKFVPGRPFFEEWTTQTKQALRVMENDVVQTQKQTFYFRRTPQERTGDRWSLRQKIEGAKLDIDVGGSRVTYDSTRKQTGEGPLANFYKALVGSEFTLTVGKDYKVLKVEGPCALGKKLAASSPNVGALTNHILNAATVRRTAERLLGFGALPGKPVRPGGRWSRTTKVSLGPLGKGQVRCTYTYRGMEGPLDRIEVKGTVSGRPRGGAGMPPEDRNARVKGKVRGTILFDRARGRIARMELNQDLQFKLTLCIGGESTEVEGSQEERTTTRTSDVNPLPRPGEMERLRREKARLKRQLDAIKEALRRAGEADE